MTSTHDQTSALLDAALETAARGWKVFPLRTDSKIAAVSHWENWATTDPNKIRAQWGRGPFNIGIACGPSGLVVIDLDMPKPGKQIKPRWQRYHDAGVASGAQMLQVLASQQTNSLPGRTFTVATPSGGTHLYYRNTTGRRLSSTTDSVGWLIDTRAHGGYVVAPGSTVPGGAYRAVDTHEAAPIVCWLAALITSKPAAKRPPKPRLPVMPANSNRRQRYAHTSLAAEIDRLSSTLEGSRNDALNRAAYNLGQLIGAGLLSHETVERLLTAAALHIGLTPRETAATLTSGLTAGMRNPRKVRS